MNLANVTNESLGLLQWKKGVLLINEPRLVPLCSKMCSQTINSPSHTQCGDTRDEMCQFSWLRETLSVELPPLNTLRRSELAWLRNSAVSSLKIFGTEIPDALSSQLSFVVLAGDGSSSATARTRSNHILRGNSV